MTDQKPNCGNCTNEDCECNDARYNPKEFGSNIISLRREFIAKKGGCLSHPGARAWLMRDVIEELEQQIIAAKKEHNHERIAGYAKAITFIQDGVEK